ncbi:MAG: hypothetical protein QNJ47_26960 [Nostocaceae cyanobacterium]|nr:hypothetical protein [Nostocaceae cyanobacterium]
MEIITFHFEAVITLDNYSHEKIGFEVKLEDGETSEEVAKILRDKAASIIGENAQQLYYKKDSLEREVHSLTERLAKLRKEWNATAQFLRSQGIKPESPSMPQFGNLLAAAQELETVDDAEFIEPQ